MKPETAKKALHLLQRANLTGSEVPAYIEVYEGLFALANPQQVQAVFDAAVDARDTPSGATLAPDELRGD